MWSQRNEFDCLTFISWINYWNCQFLLNLVSNETRLNMESVTPSRSRLGEIIKVWKEYCLIVVIITFVFRLLVEMFTWNSCCSAQTVSWFVLPPLCLHFMVLPLLCLHFMVLPLLCLHFMVLPSLCLHIMVLPTLCLHIMVLPTLCLHIMVLPTLCLHIMVLPTLCLHIMVFATNAYCVSSF